MVKDLLSKGANVNSPNNDYDLMFPIVVAVQEGKTEISNLLLANGANVNQTYTCCICESRVEYQTVFILSACFNRLSCVRARFSCVHLWRGTICFNTKRAF